MCISPLMRTEQRFGPVCSVRLLLWAGRGGHSFLLFLRFLGNKKQWVTHNTTITGCHPSSFFPLITYRQIFPKRTKLIAVAQQRFCFHYLLLLLLLPFRLALVIRVRGTLTGLDELSTLEAVVAASSFPVLITSCRLPLLLLLFTSWFFSFPNKSIMQRKSYFKSGMSINWSDTSLTSWKWRWASCHSLCTPSLLFHTPP